MDKAERVFAETLAKATPLSPGARMDLVDRLIQQLVAAMDGKDKATPDMPITVKLTFVELATVLGIVQRSILAYFGIDKQNVAAQLDPEILKLFKQ